MEHGNEIRLERTTAGLELVGGGMRVVGDFSRLGARLAQGRLQRELLVRAARVKRTANPVAIDATAGLGEDALLLAAAGFAVELYERNPLVAALLRDAMWRGAQDPRLTDVLGRMHLHEEDSLPALARLETPPDVVLLDPMFPARRKDAAVKKKLQLLQRLEEPCDDEAALLDAALAARPRKVVVKRPAKGPNLAGRSPARSLQGKAVRFDVYLAPQRAND